MRTSRRKWLTPGEQVEVFKRFKAGEIVDARSRQVVARYDRHVIDCYSGQFGLEAVAFAFAHDGGMVWVSDPVKGLPPGLTGYVI